MEDPNKASRNAYSSTDVFSCGNKIIEEKVPTCQKYLFVCFIIPMIHAKAVMYFDYTLRIETLSVGSELSASCPLLKEDSSKCKEKKKENGNSSDRLNDTFRRFRGETLTTARGSSRELSNLGSER